MRFGGFPGGIYITVLSLSMKEEPQSTERQEKQPASRENAQNFMPVRPPQPPRERPPRPKGKTLHKLRIETKARPD